MSTPQQIESAIKKVQDQASFINLLLKETLNWQIPEGIENIEEMAYVWSADELRADGLDAKVVDGKVLQIQPFQQDQQWGIFLLEFKNVDAFVKGRGLTGPLRKVLRGLVRKKRQQANRPAWDRENLLFICTYNYQHYCFAYFKAPHETRLAPLTTFGWGPDTPTRTACEFNLPALQWSEDPDKRASDWRAAFDKEKLSKLFFEQYKALADILRSDLKKQSGDLNWAHDYTLQLVNRIMFLHFIQRKRWLGNDTDFLKSFWDEYQTSGQPKDTFFDNWLKVLFFEAFNNRFNYGHSHFSPKTKDALSQAPYLNGGLFMENPLDRQADTYDITISDERIGQILAFFGKYNFTVSEDTPLDKDVAVDPEMIGMVYESLVNISEDEDRRGEAGIFYTPRVEMDMMCRLTLVDWLCNHLGTQHKNLLYQWIFAYDEQVKNSATALVTAGKLEGPLKELLSGITVLDPACGSGSFLVGMLHILDDLRERLEKCDKVFRSAYERRKEIIGSNLYGVDIKDWACHVAELRLWLTLIIDVDMTAAELHVRREPLLPNFSFNIRCGDSLVQEVGGVDMAHRRGSLDLSHGIKLKLAELRKEKTGFYNNDPQRKCETASELEQMEVRVFRDLLEDRIKATDDKAKDLMRIQAQKEANQQRNLMTGELEGPTKQFTLDRAQREKDIAALMEEKARLENALNGLRNKANAPFVWDIAFAEIFGGDRSGFDIVIGNPPYVRQENIANPDPHIDRKQAAQPEAKKEYKAKVARSIYKAFPWYFDYKEATDKAARHQLDKRSDLYIYFYFKGLSLLNDRGTFCFITSNSWLDVGYGADLQEFLLRRSQVKLVIDNKAKRSFKSAGINTVIVLLGAPLDRKASDETSLANTARFVMFNIPFEDAVSADTFLCIEKATERVRRDAYRVFAACQQNLLEEGLEQREEEEEEAPKPKKAKSPGIGIKIAKYIGNKWGARYLRSPDIYMRITAAGTLMCKFAKIASHIQRNNLQELKHKEFGLREEYPDGFPFLHSVKDVDSIRIDPKRLPKVIPSKGQKNAKWLIPDLISNRFIGARLCFFEGGNFLINDSFFIANFRPEYRRKTVLALMNSTLSLLMLELLGRKNMGEGVLCIYGPELSEHTLLDPLALNKEKVSEIEQVYDKMATREILPIFDEVKMTDRQRIDSIVSSILGLSKGEQEAVYEAVVNMVEARLSKASSLDPKKVEKRLDAVDATTGIWLDSPSIIPEDDDEE